MTPIWETEGKIYLLKDNPARKRCRFATSLTGKFAQQCYRELSKIDADLPEFKDGYYSDPPKEKIVQATDSLIKQIRLMRVLRQYGFELPNYLDIEILGKLELDGSTGVSAGFIINAENSSPPELTKPLIEKAKQYGWKLPLIWPLSDLDYIVSKGLADRIISEGNVQVIPLDNPTKVIFGKRASKIVKKFSGYHHKKKECLKIYRDYQNGQAPVPVNSFYSPRLSPYWIVGECTYKHLKKQAIAILSQKQAGLEEYKAGLEGKIAKLIQEKKHIAKNSDINFKEFQNLFSGKVRLNEILKRKQEKK